MMTRKNMIMNMYFKNHLKPVDIAKKLNISKSAVTQILQQDERYRKIKLERKIVNQKRHVKETKDFINSKRKVIQFNNNADDLILRKMHDQASRELSKANHLTNMAYRNWNKSAYSYNEKKKRFEFKKELGRSNDVPKHIKIKI